MTIHHPPYNPLLEPYALRAKATNSSCFHEVINDLQPQYFQLKHRDTTQLLDRIVIELDDVITRR